MADEFDPYSTGVEYQVTKVDPTNPETKGAVYQVHKVDEVTAAMSGKFYRARIIKDPSDPTVKGKVYQIVIIDDPDDPSVKGKVFNAIITGDQEVVVVGPAVPPLDLPDAVANSLTYVKAFGGTRLSNDIPLEYTQVDYAIKKGTAGVQGKFDTGLRPTVDDVKIEMQIKIGDEAQASGQTTVGSFYACQSRAAANADITGISGSSTGGTINGLQNGQSVASGIARVKDHIDLIRYEYKNGNHSIYVKDLTTNTEDTQTGTYTFGEPTKNLYIFGNTTTTNNLNNNNALHYCKIWVSGSLAFDAVPVIRNSDNAVGLYEKVSQTFIEPIISSGGGFEAGAVTTPAPSDPMDIYCNNGKISVLDHTSWNVITNPNSESGKGMFINSEGKLQKANDRGAGVFIPVTVGKQYTVLINKKITPLGTIIRYGQSNNGDLPNSAEQLLDWYRGAIEDMMLISFTAKRPYFVMQLAAALVEVGGIDEAVEVIEAAGDNETLAIRTRNLNNDATNTDDYYIGADGSIVASANSCYSDIIPVVAGETYVWSGICGGSSYNNKRVHAYVDGVWNQQVAYEQVTAQTPFTISFTVPAGCNGIRISHFNDDAETQVELGSTKTAYVAYNDSTATVNNLFKLNTYPDVQEILTGATSHKCNIKIFDGTENWETTAQSTVYRLVSQVLFALPNICICSHYVGVNSSLVIADMPNMSIKTGSETLSYMYIKDSSYNNNLAGFKQFLADQYAAGTPVIVIYPLATPYEEPAPVAQTMNVVAGDNTLDIVQAGLPDLLVEAEYTKE